MYAKIVITESARGEGSGRRKWEREVGEGRNTHKQLSVRKPNFLILRYIPELYPSRKGLYRIPEI
jgi:hypothetical protein